MTRKRKRSSPRPAGAPALATAGPDWLSIDGRLMFVVGYTPGGSPFGVFDDEMGDFVAGDGTGTESPF